MSINRSVKLASQLAGAIVFAMTALSFPANAAEEAAFGNTWHGPYLGAHIGGGFGNIDGLGALAGVDASDKMNGFLGGVLAGWNMQQDNWVFGLETDASLSGIDGSIVVLGVNVAEDIKWSGNLRARVGLLVTPDVLAFAAGGLAIANYDIKTDSQIAGNDSQTFVGWTIGGGVEANISSNWKARVEYLYTDYGTETMFSSVGGVNVSPQTHAVRAAIIMNF